MRSYLVYVLGIVALVVLTSAAGFYAAEIRTEPERRQLRRCASGGPIVTVTTIGYGDILPRHPLGRIVGGFLMFAGIGALGIFTASIAAYLIKFDRLDALRIRGLNGHVVICGLGQRRRAAGAGVPARRATRCWRSRRTEDNPHIAAAREAGVAVLIGDAARAEVLARARLDRAKHVVVVAGTDANNVEIAAQARALVSAAAASNLSCSTQIQDPDLWYALRSWDVGTRDGFRLEFFNVTELGARALLAKYSPFTPETPRERHATARADRRRRAAQPAPDSPHGASMAGHRRRDQAAAPDHAGGRRHRAGPRAICTIVIPNSMHSGRRYARRRWTCVRRSSSARAFLFDDAGRCASAMRTCASRTKGWRCRRRSCC